MVLKIIQIGDPILETPAQAIKSVSHKEVQSLAKDMMETCEKLRDRSAGLSANQVGRGVRLCICRRTDLEEQQKKGKKVRHLSKTKLWEVMINPEIAKQVTGESTYWEGCLSIGENEKTAIYGPVSRADRIEVQYTTLEGEIRRVDAKGFFAHVVQHEVDHLNGILFISRVPNPEHNLWKGEEFDKYYERVGETPRIRL